MGVAIKDGRGRQALYGGLIILECLIWGIGNPLIKMGLESVPPFLFITLRYTLALLLFLVIFRGRIFRQLNRGNILKCLGVGALIASAFILSNFALMLTSATTAGFFMGVSVLFTPFLSRLVLGKRMDKKLWAVILLVVVGMYMLCVNDGSFSFGAGEGIALLCSFLFAGGLVFSSKYIQDIGPAALSASQSFVAGALSFICSLIFEGVPAVHTIDVTGWAVILYLGIFSTFAAFLLQNIALKHVSAVFGSLAFCTEPIFTAVASYFMLDERLSWVGIAGAAVITVGMVLAAFVQDRPSKA